MRIKLDFNIYKEPGNSLDFENAEKLFLANKRIILGRLMRMTKDAINTNIPQGARMCINNSGSISHNIPILSIWVALTKLHKEEVCFSVTKVVYVKNYYNPSPGPGGCGPVNEEYF